MKTCEEIVFYCESKPLKDTFEGKDVYASWPRLTHYDPEGPRRWATTYERVGDSWRDRKEVPGFEVTMSNTFEDACIFDEVDSRGQSAKIPQAVVYCKEKDCYLKFDFRTDGLIEALCNSTIAYGVIQAPMAFRFAGANYFFVPRESKSFAEFKKKFEQAQKPKTKKSTEIEVGVPFVGSFDSVYRYMGAFKCVQDDTYDPHGHLSEVVDYGNKTVHVYQDCRKRPWRNDDELVFDVVKSKMNVKSLDIPEDCEVLDRLTSGVHETDLGSKGGYGFNAKCVVDLDNMTVKYVKKPQQRRPGMCGWPWS